MTTIVHLSDIHIRQGWEEEQGIVISEFFSDLEKQLQEIEDCWVIFSGDIVQSGSDREQFRHFETNFISRLKSIGIESNKIIFAPGNHDADRNFTEEHYNTLKAIQERNINETEFNDCIYGEFKKQVSPKFQNFIEFVNRVSEYNYDEDGFAGRGFCIGGNIGVYCLNTSLFSFGGLRDRDDNVIDDDRNLPVETRILNRWLQENDFSPRILVMHHPSSWLVGWAREAIESMIDTKFDVVLCGHTHKKEAFHKSNGVQSSVQCVAPPLFTSKDNVLGYSIIQINEKNNDVEILYRQWQDDRFLLGVSLSKTDNGKVKFQKQNVLTEEGFETSKFFSRPSKAKAAVASYLKNRFEESLVYHRMLPKVWVNPNLSDAPENVQSNKLAAVFSAKSLTKSLRDCVIKSPPQFGLTSLGRYIAWEYWKNNPGNYILFLDTNEIGSYEASIEKGIRAHLQERSLDIRDLKGIILDEHEQFDERKIKNLKNHCPNIPLIVLVRIDDHENIGQAIDCSVGHTFPEYYLWSLDRHQIRSVVEKFIESGYDLDEDQSTQRISDDLENLNLHRTPLNCSILLAVYQQQIDANPANRTEMLEKFLNLIFSNHKKRHDYGNSPDMKDSFYVLGAFSEILIKNHQMLFSKKEFIDFSTNYCDGLAVDVDIEMLFDIMLTENIFIQRSEMFSFRYLYWLYFFLAHRMHHSAEFLNYIIGDVRYTAFPEIIEFYSGIDRRREELVDVLIGDLTNLNNAFEERTKIDASFDPYSDAKWSPTEDDVRALEDHINAEISQTSLPKSQKDEVADNRYDRSRPYIQELNAFVKDSSLYECLQVMRAASRALRNSDYVNPEKKMKLLEEILRAWKKMFQTLVILSPIFVKDKTISFERIRFYLDSSFDHLDGRDLWRAILGCVPENVVSYYEKDFASARMTPLIRRYLDESENAIESYILIANLIRQRPRGWAKIVEKYLRKLDKDSFYLLSAFREARREYRFGFCDNEKRREIENLLGLAIAKHQLKQKQPRTKAIRNAAKSVISKINREV